MQHQYGKDWARKAPIRLCDRVLYGILNKTGEEVILLSQVIVLCTEIIRLVPWLSAISNSQREQKIVRQNVATMQITDLLMLAGSVVMVPVCNIGCQCC